MSDYLLQIAIGPIQDFISAARRTRDLWFGSTMLSEIAKAVALSVSQNDDASLIFPSVPNIADLKPNTDLSVANVILAEIDGADPEKLKAISEAARRAARERLDSYAKPVFERMERWVDKGRWDAQIEDVLEFYCAWVPVNGNYAVARKQVARLLAARKNLRDFEPNRCSDRVHKCALDALRESVFNTWDGRPKEMAKDFRDGVRINPNEALDAIALIKRVPTGGNERFPSVSRVAMDPWIRGKGSEFIERNKRVLFQYCDDLVEHGVLNRVMNKTYRAFPYEGSVLAPSRHAAMMAEFGNEKSPRREEVEKRCGDIAGVINNLPKKEQPPEPYLAFLCADGDRMGATLSKMKTAEAHRKFSSDLSEFAGKAREIIEEHNGVCVYTGGDDVMAFLPLDTALKCARDLHEEFHTLMGKFGDPQQPPSLSVGISIAHAMEDLELLLQYGREAEKAAKGKDRDGLAVSVRARGNASLTVREQWRAGEGEGLAGMPLDQRLEWWAERFLEGKIPNKFPYELRENAGFYDGWKDKEETDKEALKSAVTNDVMRVFKRKEIRLSDDEKQLAERYIEAKVKDANSIRALSDELLLAQWISFGLEQAKKKKEDSAERKGEAQ